MGVLTRVVLLASFVSTAAVFVVVISVSVVVVGSVSVCELVSCVVSSVGSAAVVTALGGNVVRVDVLAFGAVLLDAVITAFMAAIFALSVFSRHFFLLPRLPCPGPCMVMGTDWDWCAGNSNCCWSGLGLVLVLVLVLVLCNWFCGLGAGSVRLGLGTETGDLRARYF